MFPILQHFRFWIGSFLHKPRVFFVTMETIEIAIWTIGYHCFFWLMTVDSSTIHLRKFIVKYIRVPFPCEFHMGISSKQSIFMYSEKFYLKISSQVFKAFSWNIRILIFLLKFIVFHSCFFPLGKLSKINNIPFFRRLTKKKKKMIFIYFTTQITINNRFRSQKKNVCISKTIDDHYQVI